METFSSMNGLQNVHQRIRRRTIIDGASDANVEVGWANFAGLWRGLPPFDQLSSQTNDLKSITSVEKHRNAIGNGMALRNESQKLALLVILAVLATYTICIAVLLVRHMRKDLRPKRNRNKTRKKRVNLNVIHDLNSNQHHDVLIEDDAACVDSDEKNDESHVEDEEDDDEEEDDEEEDDEGGDNDDDDIEPSECEKAEYVASEDSGNSESLRQQHQKQQQCKRSRFWTVDDKNMNLKANRQVMFAKKAHRTLNLHSKRWNRTASKTQLVVHFSDQRWLRKVFFPSWWSKWNAGTVHRTHSWIVRFWTANQKRQQQQTSKPLTHLSTSLDYV